MPTLEPSGVISLSGAFAPTDVAGLLLWVKADAGTYQDSALTTPAAADGDPVGGWQDQSGQNHHLTQATAGRRPLLKTSRVGALPGIRADGANDSLSVLLDDTNTRTLFVVARTISYQVTRRVWGWEAASACVFDNNTQWAYYQANGGIVNLGGSPTSVSLIVFRQTGDLAATVGIGTAAATSLTLNQRPVQRFTLFDDTQAAQDPWNGEIYEAILYDSALSAANITAVSNYLARWGYA